MPRKRKAPRTACKWKCCACTKPPSKPAETLPLSEEEQQKLANWQASLETHHAPEQLQVAREKAGKISSAALRAAVLEACERYAKKAAA